MRYLGGKSKIRKQIAEIIKLLRKPGQVYIEPFVGGAWVLQEVDGVRIANDACKSLIHMYRGLQGGWVPPNDVSRETQQWVRHNVDETDPMYAFCAFGCSFGGVYWAGYTNTPKAGPGPTSRSLLKQLPLIQDVTFLNEDYRDLLPYDAIVYCDLPYAGTSSYAGAPKFDSAAFWETMREWSKHNTVLISEYTAPPDFACLAEFKSRMGLRVKDGGQEVRTEKLFTIDTSVNT